MPCNPHSFSARSTTRRPRKLRGRVAARGCSCIDWSMHPQRRVINHLAPVSTRCTSFPSVVCIARVTPLKGSEKKEKKTRRKSLPIARGDETGPTIFQSPAESATRVLPFLRATRPDLLCGIPLSSLALYRGTVDRAIGRKNAILVAPHGVISSSASSSTRRIGARRIMQSRLARRSPSVLAPRYAVARLFPSIISRIGYRRHAPPERSAEPRLASR